MSRKEINRSRKTSATGGARSNLVICGLWLASLAFSAPVCFAQHETQPTEQQQGALRAFLQKELGSAESLSYVAAFVDLRDDGAQEAIVYLTDQNWCGSGGCVTLVLEPTGSAFKVVTKMTVTRLPIRVLKSKSNGWHDLSVLVAGGGIHLGYEAKLSFDGTTYPSNPSVPPAEPMAQTAEGVTVIPASELNREFLETRPNPGQNVQRESVIPGQAAGTLRLGTILSDQPGSVFAWQSKPFGGAVEDTCGHTSVIWFDDENRSPGVEAFLADHKVFQIEVESNRFQVEGVGNIFGKPALELTNLFPDGELFRWKDSWWRVPSQKDELFWVVKSQGIAFELDYGYERNSQSRIVMSVVVFPPDGNFEPEGCLRGAEALVPASSPNDP
jgi:hypothetical protein